MCCKYRQKAKCRAIKKKKQGRMKYEQSTREYNKKIPVRARISAPIQTTSGAHPASYTMGTRALFPGVKMPGRGVNHPLPSSCVVREYSYTSTPLWALKAFLG
jgi:hypothetical protein